MNANILIYTHYGIIYKREEEFPKEVITLKQVETNQQSHSQNKKNTHNSPQTTTLKNKRNKNPVKTVMIYGFKEG